jgi:hypothetical protein
VSRKLLVAFAFVVGLHQTYLHEPLNKPLTFDNQVYYYMAERAAGGVPPHVSLVDHKHHLPAIVSGWSIYVGRLFGADDLLAMRVPSIIGAGVVTACVAWVAAELAGLWAGALAMLALLVMPGLFSQAAMGVRPQLFMAAFMMLALAEYGLRRRFWAGVSAVCGFLCWTPAALIGVALALSALLERDRIRAIAALAAGAVTAFLTYELYYLLHGALDEQLRQSFMMAGDLAGYAYNEFHESLQYFLRFGIGWRRDTSVVLSGAFLAVLALAPFVIAFTPRRAFALARRHPAWPAALVSSYFATGLTFLTHQGYPDMFFVEPLIAVTSGVLLAGVAALAARILRHELARLAVVAAAAAWLIVLQTHRRNVFWTGGVHLAAQRDLAKQIDFLADDYGSVWAVGCPHLLALGHRENFLPYGLLIDPKVRAYMMRDTEPGKYLPLRDGKLPGAILTARGGIRAVMPWMTREYRRVMNKSFESHGIQVWVRRPPRPGDRRRPGSVR